MNGSTTEADAKKDESNALPLPLPPLPPPPPPPRCEVPTTVDASPENVIFQSSMEQLPPEKEKKMQVFRQESNLKVKQLHDNLAREIEALNARVAAEYTTINTEAENEIMELRQKIEYIITRTSMRQQKLYEDMCRQTKNAKENTNKKIQQLTEERSKLAAAILQGTDSIDIVKENESNDCIDKNAAEQDKDSINSVDNHCPSDVNIGSTSLLLDTLASVSTDQMLSEENSESLRLSSTSTQCAFQGCQKRPSCNFKGQSTALFCGEHKLNNMINVTVKRCEAQGCNKMPGCNYPGFSVRRYCVDHKLDGMVNVVASNIQKRPSSNVSNTSQICQVCEASDCQELAIFNFPGQTRRRFCAKHKLDDMVNLDLDPASNQEPLPRQLKKRRVQPKSSTPNSQSEPKKTRSKRGRCEAEGCHKHPSFNFKGITGGRFCSLHKLNGMIDVISKRCEECHKQAAFNFEGQSRGRFCSSHKLVGMINVKDKLCEMVGCSKYPTSNFEGMSGRRFCTTHKLAGMVTFTNKRCEAVGCLKHPKFNFEGKPGRRFCATHKLEGMVAIS